MTERRTDQCQPASPRRTTAPPGDVLARPSIMTSAPGPGRWPAAIAAARRASAAHRANQQDLEPLIRLLADALALAALVRERNLAPCAASRVRKGAPR
jgi:hypothetical protein